MLGLYYRIGEHIDKNAVYGNKFIDNLSMDLKISFPNSKGFSSRNLRDMHKYYQICISDPIWQTASAKLPWSHLTLIFHKIEDKNTRLWYINETAKAGWSYDTLALQIKTDVYSRQVLNEKSNNYDVVLPENTGKIANELMKDPYILNLASLDADFIERELENKMVEQIKTVLIELGTGFSFVGSEFEKMIDCLFNGVDDRSEYNPRGTWELENKEPFKSSTMRPDTIIKNDNELSIIDSKYYRYGATGDINNGLPDTQSIQKQITYAKHAFENNNKLNVYNAFLLPFDKNDKKNSYNGNLAWIGKATTDWEKEGRSYEKIHTFLIDLRFVIENYNKDDNSDIIDLFKNEVKEHSDY